MVPSTPGCSMDNINNKKHHHQNQGLIGAWLICAGPIPKEEEGHIRLLLLKILGHLMSGSLLSHSILTFKDKTLTHVFLLWGGVSIARTFPEPGG